MTFLAVRRGLFGKKQSRNSFTSKIWFKFLLLWYFSYLFEACKLPTPLVIIEWKRAASTFFKTSTFVIHWRKKKAICVWNDIRVCNDAMIFIFVWTVPLIIAHSHVASVERSWCRIRNFSRVIWAFIQWNNPNTFSSGRMRRLDWYESWRTDCASRPVCASL